MQHVWLHSLYLQNLQNEIGSRIFTGIFKGCQTVLVQLNWENDSQFILIQSSGCVSVVTHALIGRDGFPCVRQAALLLLGVRLIRELLAWASSLMDTLPLCLMKSATESNSAGVMEINFPLSSITPAGSTSEREMKSKCDMFGSRKAS